MATTTPIFTKLASATVLQEDLLQTSPENGVKYAKYRQKFI
jgi:hypothetical protein